MIVETPHRLIFYLVNHVSAGGAILQVCGNRFVVDLVLQGSWVILFLKGRQLLVFELARILQFLLIDCFLLAFRFVSHAIGPWVTIFCIQVRRSLLALTRMNIVGTLESITLT